MNMENPNKDLIRFIDAILHEMEISPKQDKITLSNLTLPFPSNYQNLIRQNKLFAKLKGEAAEDSEILGFRKLPLFYIIKKPNREKLLEIRKGLAGLKSDSSLSENDISIAQGKLSFDEHAGDIILGGEKCSLPLQTNQYFLCKKMFGVPFGTRVKEIEILDLIDWDKDSRRSVYDAMRAINQRAKKSLGIEIFNWRNNHIWIKEIFAE